MAAAKRDSWSNNFGFIMAAAGAAVGLGNIWRFPYVCGENGGGAFLIAYIACVLLIGMPVLWAELAIGRASGKGSGSAFVTLLKKNSKVWKMVGLLGVIVSLLITSYYTIIAGWTLEYLWHSVTGGVDFATTDTTGYFDAFMASDSRQIFWHVIFSVITIFVVLGGVSGGIEKAAEILMPILLFILVGLAFYSVRLEADLSEIPKGLSFLFTPDWSKFTWHSLYEALGQAAFSLSIAVGTMIAYGSYLDKKENIPALGSIVVLMDTAVALLGGIVIFPIVFAFGLNPEAGTGLVFVTLPNLFAQIPGGMIIAPVFYTLLFFAALTSSISLLEPSVTHLIDEMQKSRFVATLVAGATSIVLGVIWIWTSTLEQATALTNIDKLISDLLIPIEAIMIAVFAAWILKKSVVEKEIGASVPVWLYKVWRYCCKWLCPVGVAVILIFKILSSWN